MTNHQFKLSEDDRRNPKGMVKISRVRGLIDSLHGAKVFKLTREKDLEREEAVVVDMGA